MRYMILVKSTPEFEAGTAPPAPDAVLVAAMTQYHQTLAAAGVLLDAGGLQPSRHGWRIHYDGPQRRVVDGPFAEASELVAGFTIIQARSREEALEWSRRFPNPVGEGRPAVIEVRRLHRPGDFAPGAPAECLRPRDTPSPL